MSTDTEARLAAALEEQTRLLRKADRRGGCIFNLVMVVLFGAFYLAWLAIKRLAKWTWWALVMVGRLLRALWRALVAAARWTWHQLHRGGSWVAGKVSHARG